MMFYISQIALVVFLCVCCYQAGKGIGFSEGIEFANKYSDFYSAIKEAMAAWKEGAE